MGSFTLYIEYKEIYDNNYLDSICIVMSTNGTIIGKGDSRIYWSLQKQKVVTEQLVRGSSPTGAHFGPQQDYISGSLLKEARCKIAMCVLYHIVIV